MIDHVTDKSVITIATSKKLYVDMACNLAMSFLLWNDINDINFFLVTDHPEFIPQKLADKISVIKIAPGELGDGFSAKLHLDKFAYTRQVMFIDADCLVYNNLEHAFTAFNGHQVSAVGYKRYAGKDIGFCKDIATVMANTGIKYFPLLCGSIYYFEKGQIATAVFNYARSILKSYHEIGLVSLRNKENEEPLLAIAMAKFNQQPVNDTGLIKADRMFYEFLDTNVIRGNAQLWNKKSLPVPEYSTLKLALPAIVHFNAAYAEVYEYKSEEIRLRQVFFKNNSTAVANALAFTFAILPGKFAENTKNIFRPLYQAIFGYRKIKKSNRL